MAVASKKRECMGCHSCEVACKLLHRLNIGPRLIHVIEKSSDFLPVYSYRSAKTPCIDICRTKAFARNKDGLARIDEKECIGFCECTNVCTFGAIQFSDDRAVASKCFRRLDRITKGLNTACVTTSPTGCIAFPDTRQYPWERLRSCEVK